jgi:phage FluMu protein Com
MPGYIREAGKMLYDCMRCEKTFWRAGDLLKAKCPGCGKMVHAFTKNPSSYAGDPYWTRARFKGKCWKCMGLIRKGDPIYYYPKSKRVYCDGASCGKAANQDFISMRDDEDMYNRKNPSSKRSVVQVRVETFDGRIILMTFPKSKWPKTMDARDRLIDGRVAPGRFRRWDEITSRSNPSGFMWGLMPEAAAGEALASLYGRNRIAKPKDGARRSRPRSIQRRSSRRSIRSNPSLGMPWMPHTWVTASGVKVHGGDTVEFWDIAGHPRGHNPAKVRAKVNKMLVFDDHVQVSKGWAGTRVDDRNFIRVVRRA